MGEPRLVLLGATHELIDRADALGIDALVVTSGDRLCAERPMTHRQVLVLDFTRDGPLVAMVRAAHAHTPFLACVSLTEHGLQPAAAINEALGLAWMTPPTAALIRDKALMRQRLDERGISPVPARVVDGRAELMAFGDEVGYPLIVKPATGVGSLEVHLVRSAHDVARLPFEAVHGHGRVLAERYLEGPEYSVESFSFNGDHACLAITEKHLLGRGSGTFVEIGHAMPAPIGERDRDEIWATVAAMLSALGLTDGPAHTEVRLTAAGPRIIETHGRVGGDHIRELIFLTTGIDVYDLTLRWAAGEDRYALLADPARAADPGGVVAHPAAAVRYFVPPAGRLTSVVGVERLRGAPGLVDFQVTVAAGDRVPEVRRSADRRGYVLAVGDCVPAAVDRCRHAIGQVRFGYAGGDVRTG